MESGARTLGSAQKRRHLRSLRVRRVCRAGSRVSHSKERLSKDDALGGAGHTTGKVGKCHPTGAYTYPTSSGNFQRILEKGTE